MGRQIALNADPFWRKNRSAAAWMDFSRPADRRCRRRFRVGAPRLAEPFGRTKATNRQDRMQETRLSQ